MSSAASASRSDAHPIADAPVSLCAREPHVPADRLVAEMVPPPRFDSVRFENYHPDPGQPSQAEAVRVLSGFAAGLGDEGTARRRRWFKREAPAPAGARPARPGRAPPVHPVHRTPCAPTPT